MLINLEIEQIKQTDSQTAMLSVHRSVVNGATKKSSFGFNGRIASSFKRIYSVEK